MTLVRSIPAPPDRGRSTARAATPQELLAGMRRNDPAAFEEFVRSTSGPMLAVARRILGCEAEAQDALQEAYSHAFRGLSRFDERAQLETWLHRIVVNACLMKLRTLRRRKEVPLGSLLPEYGADGHRLAPEGAWAESWDDPPERGELRAIVRSRIDLLPAPYREVVLLRDIEQLDTQETADHLGLTPAAVKTRLHRARQALRTLLADVLAGGEGGAAGP